MSFDTTMELPFRSLLRHLARWAPLATLMVFAIVAFPVNSSELDRAPEIYETHFSTAPTGVYVNDSTVFVITEIPIDNKRLRAQHYEGKALLLTHKLLKSHMIRSLRSSTAWPKLPPGKLREHLNDFIYSDAFSNFTLTGIKSRVLVNRKLGDTYRRVTAFPSEEILKKRNEINSALINNSEELINSVLDHAKHHRRFDDLSLYSLELGLLRKALTYRKMTLDNQYNLVNFPVNNSNPPEKRNVLRDSLEPDHATIESETRKGSAPDLEIIDQIKAELDERDYLGRIALDLTCLPMLPDRLYRARLHSIKKNIVKLGEKYPAIEEEATVFFMPDGVGLPLNFPRTDILQPALASFGFLGIDPSYSSGESDYFREARNLFKRGIAIDRIVQLLIQSLETAPRHVESWLYLGAALAHKGQLYRAMAIFQQAHTLDSDNLEIVAHLADMYHRLKLTKTAKAYRSYLMSQAEKHQTKFVRKVIDKIS